MDEEIRREQIRAFLQRRLLDPNVSILAPSSGHAGADVPFYERSKEGTRFSVAMILPLYDFRWVYIEAGRCVLLGCIGSLLLTALQTHVFQTATKLTSNQVCLGQTPLISPRLNAGVHQANLYSPIAV